MQTTHLSPRDNNRSSTFSVQELIDLAGSDLRAWISIAKTGSTFRSHLRDNFDPLHASGDVFLDQRLCEHLNHVLDGKQDAIIYPTPPAFISSQGDLEAKFSGGLTQQAVKEPSNHQPFGDDDHDLFSPEHESLLDDGSILPALDGIPNLDNFAPDPPMVTEHDFDFFDSPIHNSPNIADPVQISLNGTESQDAVLRDTEMTDTILEDASTRIQTTDNLGPATVEPILSRTMSLADENGVSLSGKTDHGSKSENPDSKYIGSGKYGFSGFNHDLQDPSNLTSNLTKLGLPRIGLYPVSDDDASSTSSDDEVRENDLVEMQDTSDPTTNKLHDKSFMSLGIGDGTLFGQESNAANDPRFGLVDHVKLKLSSKTRLWPLMVRLLLSQLDQFEHNLDADPHSNPPTKLTMNSSYQVRLLLPPDIRLRRGEESADVHLGAFDFWTELKLQPQHGSRNLNICLVHASDIATQGGVGLFKDIISSTYEAHLLGLLNFRTILYQDIWQESSACHNFLVNLFQSQAGVAGGKQSTKNDEKLFLVLPDFSQKTLVQVCLALAKCGTDLQQVFSRLMLFPENMMRSLPSDQILTRKRVVRLVHQIYSQNDGSIFNQSFQLSRRPPKQFIMRQPQSGAEKWKADKFLHVAYKFQSQKRYLLFCIVDDCFQRIFQTLIPMERVGSYGRAQFEAGRQMWMLLLEILKGMNSKPGLVLSSVNAEDQHMKLWHAFEERSKSTNLVLVDVQKIAQLDWDGQQHDVNRIFLETDAINEIEDQKATLARQENIILGLYMEKTNHTGPELALVQRDSDPSRNTAFKIKHGIDKVGSESLLHSMHALRCMSEIKGYEKQLPIHLAMVERGCETINKYT